MNETCTVASLRLRHICFINNERLQGSLMRSQLAQQDKSNNKKVKVVALFLDGSKQKCHLA
jgi:hypothetical protein